MVEECNLAYVKKLVRFFFNINLEDLFLALLLFEIYEPSDYEEIKKLRKPNEKTMKNEQRKNNREKVMGKQKNQSINLKIHENI